MFAFVQCNRTFRNLITSMYKTSFAFQGISHWTNHTEDLTSTRDRTARKINEQSEKIPCEDKSKHFDNFIVSSVFIFNARLKFDIFVTVLEKNCLKIQYIYWNWRGLLLYKNTWLVHWTLKASAINAALSSAITPYGFCSNSLKRQFSVKRLTNGYDIHDVDLIHDRYVLRFIIWDTKNITVSMHCSMYNCTGSTPRAGDTVKTFLRG